MRTSITKKNNTKPLEGKVLITYPKLEQDKYGAPEKNGRMRVLFRFLAKMNAAPMVENDVLFHIVLDDVDTKDDTLWFRDNVIRYVDIDNTGNDSVADAKADKLIEKYHLADPDGSHIMSKGILWYYAQEMYVRLSEWRLDDVQ